MDTVKTLFLHNEILFHCHNGAFYYLPLGLRALEKLTKVIDQEMQAIGAQKISMPTMISAALWKKTGRWDTHELFKLKDRKSAEYCLGPTHEELVTNLVAQFEQLSYKRLPVMLYQLTRKFRDEMHPKFGLLRGREFEMKDMYSFDLTEEAAMQTYELTCQAYCRIFDRLKLKYVKVEGATGNIGGSMSHEYHLPASVGEDTLYLCDSCGFRSNAELIASKDDSKESKCPSVSCPNMRKQTGIEVGHAFLLGTKYSEVLKAQVRDKDQNLVTQQMGCFGLGVSRILQAGVEVNSRDDRIRWPSLIAPYQLCIIPQMQGYGSETFDMLSDELYDRLTNLPNLRDEVVIDDRTDKTVGKRKFEADAQGYPYVVIVGRKCLEDPRLYELVDTSTDTTEFLTLEQITDRLSQVETMSLLS
ncbi:probable proline--tRNA ligase, mitochondrial isoform X2 [Dreissena polymorpha]|uniref:probable proline--tRNA ligase, mitochondrial isoform X2 n=1 Tax=Dreissena polymorpha TaxID=45954 RepID=UPI002264E0E4|nr:probable proline--tRNA ligase, mitochondrial isoform X2 [Dreissena polymorpha]